MAEFFNAYSFAIAQIIGFIAVVLVLITYQFKSHKVIMFTMAVMCSLWCVHFAMLGCWSAVAMNCVNVARSIVYSFRDKKAINSRLVPFGFCIIAVVLVVFSWQGARSLLPLSGTVFLTVANWQTDTKKLKLLAIPTCLSWGAYNAISASYAGTVNEILALCSIIVFFIRTGVKKSAEQKNNSVADT